MQRREEMMTKGPPSEYGNDDDQEEILMYYAEEVEEETRGGVYSVSEDDEMSEHGAYEVDWDTEDEDDIIYDEDLEGEDEMARRPSVYVNEETEELDEEPKVGRYSSALDDLEIDENPYTDILLEEVVTEGVLNEEVVDALDPERRSRFLEVADEEGIDKPTDEEHTVAKDMLTAEAATDGVEKKKRRKYIKKKDGTIVEGIDWEEG